MGKEVSTRATQSLPRWSPPGFTFLWSLLASVQVLRLGGWTVDDFYITYRYARNLAQGHGFVFNLGERVFGLSDPGLGLLLAFFHGLTRIPIEWLASLQFATCLVALAILLARELAWRFEVLVGGTLLLLSPFVWAANGAAAPLALLLLILAARLADLRPWLAGLLAGLAMWVRPDAAAGLPLVALFSWLETRRLPWRWAVPTVVTVSAGLLLAWSWFGAPLPGTLAAKVAMGEANAGAPVGWRFWLGATLPLRRLLGPSWPWVVALGALGLVPFFRAAGRGGRLFVLVALSLAVAYPLLHTPFFTWYILLPVMVLCYGVSFLAGAVVRWAAARPKARGLHPVWSLGGTTALAALVLAGSLRRVELFQGPFVPPLRHQRYVEAARWICAHSGPEATVAHVEIGALGYFCDRQLEDLMGLVTPRVLPFVERYDTLGAFESQPTDFLLHLPGNRLEAVVRAPWFPERYEAVAKFPEGGPPAQQLTLYRRRGGGMD